MGGRPAFSAINILVTTTREILNILFANFVAHPTGELLSRPLLGTLVNRGKKKGRDKVPRPYNGFSCVPVGR